MWTKVSYSNFLSKPNSHTIPAGYKWHFGSDSQSFGFSNHSQTPNEEVIFGSGGHFNAFLGEQRHICLKSLPVLAHQLFGWDFLWPQLLNSFILNHSLSNLIPWPFCSDTKLAVFTSSNMTHFSIAETLFSNSRHQPLYQSMQSTALNTRRKIRGTKLTRLYWCHNSFGRRCSEFCETSAFYLHDSEPPGLK